MKLKDARLVFFHKMSACYAFKLSICEIGQDQNIYVINEMVHYKTEMKLKILDS